MDHSYDCHSDASDYRVCLHEAGKRCSYFLVLFMCVMLTGCNNNFAYKEYNARDKIAETEDIRIVVRKVYNPIS